MLAAAACISLPEPPGQAPACTAGQYTYCLCEGGKSGTRLCRDDLSFDACKCDGAKDPSGISAGGGRSRFEEVEPRPEEPGAVRLSDECKGKIAVLASASNGTEVFAGVFDGSGRWKTAKASSAALRGTPRGVLVTNDTVMAVWRAKADAADGTDAQTTAWTTFKAGQSTLSGPELLPDVVLAPGAATPALVTSSSGTDVWMYYAHRAGASNAHAIWRRTYSAATGEWNAAPEAIPLPSGEDRIGPPAAAALKNPNATVLVYAKNGGQVIERTWQGNAWSSETKILGTSSSYKDSAPALVALEAAQGPDLLMAYVGTSKQLLVTSRDAQSKQWKAPVILDAATDATSPRLLSLPGGRAILAWTTPNDELVYRSYDLASDSFSNQSPFVAGQRIDAASSPSLVRARCGGAEAMVTYVNKTSGKVQLLRYGNQKWEGPFDVPIDPGTNALTFAGAAEVP